ncbi:RpiB/LacA/LacB family sugar-phosphate isomerase [Candidatus Woesearchaeota archaeon]|nr:RpiB/LacA/LacB family sugar-phosphate isomerase [Candidatus Woesearchaeota archaeon]
MKVFLGCDHEGYSLKEKVKRLEGFVDRSSLLVPGDDYPDVAAAVAKEVAEKRAKGVLICGSGIGMCIAANKVAGVRAAVCRDVREAVLAREHNDANVLCLAGRVTSSDAAERIIDAFLGTRFLGGRHKRRVEKIRALERLPITRVTLS